MTTLAERVGGKNRLIGGPFGSKLTQKDYSDQGIPVIRGTNMEYDGRWIGGKYVFVSEGKVLRDLKTNLAYPGDIIVTQRGTLGQVSIVPVGSEYDRYVISQSQMAISVDHRCADPLFVYYYLKSPVFETYVGNTTIQTGVPHINLSILRNAPVDWPPLPVQTQISSILGALDDKIELNRRMSNTLEEIAQAIFRDWFVDFGPTRRRIAGASDPATIMGGLVSDPSVAQQLADLFPATIEDNGLPSEWQQSTVAYVTTFLKRGLTPVYSDSGIPVVNQRCVRNQQIDLGHARRHDVSRRAPKERLLEDGDVLINSTGVGTLGRVATVRSITEPATADSHITICRADTSMISKTVFALFLEGKEEEIAGMGHGSTGQTELSPASLGNLILPLAPKSIQAAFDQLVNPLRELAIANSAQARTLDATRDLLLPKLMSGEVTLCEAGSLAEAAE